MFTNNASCLGQRMFSLLTNDTKVKLNHFVYVDQCQIKVRHAKGSETVKNVVVPLRARPTFKDLAKISIFPCERSNNAKSSQCAQIQVRFLVQFINCSAKSWDNTVGVAFIISRKKKASKHAPVKIERQSRPSVSLTTLTHINKQTKM